MPYDPKNPEEARFKNLIDDMEYYKDFTNDLGKQVSKVIKDINLVMTEHVGNVKRFSAAMQEAEKMAYGVREIMGTVKERLYSAASAATELQTKMAAGLSMTTQEFEELNKEIRRLDDFQRVAAKDTALRRDLTKKLGEDVEDQLNNELAAKRAIMGIDATILEDKKNWTQSGMSLDELRKELIVTEEMGGQAEYRLVLAEEFKNLNAVLVEQQKEILALEARRNSLKSVAGKARVQQEIDALKTQRDGTKDLIKAKKDEFELDNKHGKLTMRTVTTRIHNLKSQAAQSRMDQAKTALLLAEKEGDKTKELAIENRKRGGYMAYMNDQGFTMLGTLGTSITKTKEWYKSVQLIPKSFVLLDFLLKSALERFMALDKAAEAFRKTTGFTIKQMAEVRKNAERINLDFADMGVSIEQAYKSAEVLTNVFGRTSLVTKEAMLNVSLLSQNLGVSEENSAQVLETFMGIGQASEKAAFDTIKLGTALSDKAGVPFAMVMKDIANASDTAINMIGSAPKKLMKAAIAARALGLDINKVAESQRKLLDFSSSITDELSASALLGKSISFQKARQLAFEGKSAEATKEILKTVKKAGDFDKMNVYQREAIARATGMSLKDLSKALAVDKQRESILQGSDEAAKSKLLAQEAELERLDKMNEEEEKNILLQNDKALKQRQMQGAMTKLKNVMDSLIIAFADILEPVMTALTDIIIPAFKGVVGILKITIIPLLNLMVFPISVVAKLLGKIGSLIEGVATRFEPVRTIIESVRKALDSTFGDVLKFVVGGGLLYLFFLKGFSMSGLMQMISKPFTALNEMATGAIKNIKSKLTGTPPKATELTSPASKPKIDASSAAETASGASDKSKNIKSGTNVKDFFKNLAQGLKYMASTKVLLGALNLIPASIGLTAMIPGAIGAKLISLVDGKKFGTALESIARGMEKMTGAKVAGGIKNMVLASIGLTAMIPGAIGAKLISLVNGKKFQEAMEAISNGIQKMAGAKISAGIKNLVLASIGLTAMIPGAIGAKIIQTVDGKKFSDALESISSGIARMANVKVLRGAINMVIASAGLTAMIPGAIGAKIISLVDGKKFSEALKSISAGMERMANVKVLRGAINMVIASAGLTAMIPGAIGAKIISLVDGKKFTDGMGGIAKGIEKFANAKLLIAIPMMLLAAVGLTALIPGAIAAAILGAIGKPIEMGLKFLASGIGYMGNPKVFLGAAGIAAVGLSILPFAYAMKMFGDVDWGAVGLGSLALIGFTAAAFGLGAILLSGVGAAIFGAGVIGIAALGAALIPFGVAALAAGVGVKMLGEGISASVDPILRLSEIDLTQTALGIGAVGVALAAFGAGSATAGLGSFVGNLLGGDPIAKMERLGKAGTSLMITANAINTISEAFQKFEAVSQFAESINVLTESLSGLNAELEKTSTIKLAALAAMTAVGGRKESKETTDQSGGGDSSMIVEKLDSIYQALVGGEVAVYMDSVKVSKKIAETA